MLTESTSLNLLSLISLISFFVALATSKLSSKIGKGILLDSDLQKPQAFHKYLIPRSGGLAGIISLNCFFILYFFIFGEFLFDYIVISTAIFFLGFLEDMKFKISDLIIIAINNAPIIVLTFSKIKFNILFCFI